MKILSWNVNGIRAIYNKKALAWFNEYQPDILCIQETKAEESQIPDNLRNTSGYYTFWGSAQKKGYSGTGIITKPMPLRVDKGFGIKKFDLEGRTLIAEYREFILFNIYYPNGKSSPERLQYKMEYYDVFLEYAVKLTKQGKNLIICGDLNTAHKEIDLSHPDANKTTSGFLPEERAWIDKFLSKGFIDTFRLFNDKPQQYTWWDYKTRARERNIGWRLDYFFISTSLKQRLKDAFILSNITGSDHCPVGIEL